MQSEQGRSGKAAGSSGYSTAKADEGAGTEKGSERKDLFPTIESGAKKRAYLPVRCHLSCVRCEERDTRRAAGSCLYYTARVLEGCERLGASKTGVLFLAISGRAKVQAYWCV